MLLNKPDSTEHRPSRLGFVLIPRFNMMTLTTLIEVLRVANYLSPDDLYDWCYISVNDAEVTASNGLTITANSIDEYPEPFDMVFVVGSWGCENYSSPELFNWLRLLNLKGVTICGIELGVYVLAQAKILAQKCITTHWSFIAGFSEQFPNSNVKEQLYTVDKNIISCGGGTASIDLMLHLIGIRHGDYLKSEVAEQMMHYPIRGPETTQRQTHGTSTGSIHPVVYSVIKLIEENIAEPIKMPEVASSLGMSQRQIERYIRRYIGCSLVQFSQLLRLQYARALLTTTGISVREASAASGFNSMSYFSYAFMKCFGKKPSQYRNAWPETEPRPSWPGTVFSMTEISRIKAQR